MVRLLASLSVSLRCEWRRRQLQRRLLDVVARLPYEPESRCTYQALLDEQLSLARAGHASPALWHGGHRAEGAD